MKSKKEMIHMKIKEAVQQINDTHKATASYNQYEDEFYIFYPHSKAPLDEQNFIFDLQQASTATSLGRYCLVSDYNLDLMADVFPILKQLIKTPKEERTDGPLYYLQYLNFEVTTIESQKVPDQYHQATITFTVADLDLTQSLLFDQQGLKKLKKDYPILNINNMAKRYQPEEDDC